MNTMVNRMWKNHLCASFEKQCRGESTTAGMEALTRRKVERLIKARVVALLVPQRNTFLYRWSDETQSD